MKLPVDICNRALDECGLPAIGDIEDGSKASQHFLRTYDDTLRELLSCHNWNFARKQDILVLIGDAYGVDHDLTDVMSPWRYMYQFPVDCVDVRWVLFEGKSIRFLVGSATRPNPPGSRWDLIEGHDPDQSKVILTNFYQPQVIYTALMAYPDAWDASFTQAMVATLAARAAMPLILDKGLARAVRGENLQIAQRALDYARERDANEGWNVFSHTPDWLIARTGYPGPFDEGIF